jgi:excisionase family DNA binding protein
MGVHPATLRAWADQGRVSSQRTAGGHRRFNRADLQAWIESRRPNDAGVQVLIQNALGHMRMEMERANAPWLARFDEETRRAHRELGRRLLHEIGRAVLDMQLNEASLAAAGDIGREYAVLSQRRSLSLIEALRAFLFFRDGIVDSLVQMSSALEPIAAPSWQAVHHQLSAFLNAVLIALVQSYAESRRD